MKGVETRQDPATSAKSVTHADEEVGGAAAGHHPATDSKTVIFVAVAGHKGLGRADGVIAWVGQVRSSFVEFFGFLRSNDTYNVERLLRKGFEHVNMREERLGDTPLIFACSRGWAAMARLLLQGGGPTDRQEGGPG